MEAGAVPSKHRGRKEDSNEKINPHNNHRRADHWSSVSAWRLRRYTDEANERAWRDRKGRPREKRVRPQGRILETDGYLRVERFR